MSPKDDVLRMRASNRRRCTSSVRPIKAITPETPPTLIAIHCLKVCEIPIASKIQIGVSRPPKWPRKITSTPMWNRLEPQNNWRRRRSWLDPLRQVYCSRSKRSQLPTRKGVRPKKGDQPDNQELLKCVVAGA